MWTRLTLGVLLHLGAHRYGFRFGRFDYDSWYGLILCWGHVGHKTFVFRKLRGA
jgi:hypothetical protein